MLYLSSNRNYDGVKLVLGYANCTKLTFVAITNCMLSIYQIPTQILSNTYKFGFPYLNISYCYIYQWQSYIVRNWKTFVVSTLEDLYCSCHDRVLRDQDLKGIIHDTYLAIYLIFCRETLSHNNKLSNNTGSCDTNWIGHGWKCWCGHLLYSRDKAARSWPILL